MISLVLPAMVWLASASSAAPQYDAHGWARVDSSKKISQTAGSFGGLIQDESTFGRDVSPIGDLNGDGVVDLAVGTPRDSDGGLDRGAVWILFLRPDGTVQDQTKISDTQGGFTGYLDDLYRFGFSVAGLGDLDGDCIPDLAVGCIYYGFSVVWILFLNTNGTVKRHEAIYYPSGTFGYSVTCLGDLDGDGVQDIAVGDPDDDDGGMARGAVWVLFLRTNGSVKSYAKISSTSGGFPGFLPNRSQLGFHVANVGDLDEDGHEDLAVGGVHPVLSRASGIRVGSRGGLRVSWACG